MWSEHRQESFLFSPGALTHTLLAGLGDEFPLAVNAGVRTLAGDSLLPLGHVTGWRRATARVGRTWDWTQGMTF